MNYEFFYGLTFNPFTKGLPAQDVFESADYKQFSSRMEYFKSTKGFACVYGEPGSGKTTSLRAFIAKLNPQLFRVVYLPLSTTTVQDFYRHLAVGLGLLLRFRKVDLFHQIQEQIVKAAIQKNRPLLSLLTRPNSSAMPSCTIFVCSLIFRWIRRTTPVCFWSGSLYS